MFTYLSASFAVLEAVVAGMDAQAQEREFHVLQIVTVVWYDLALSGC